MRSKKIDLSQRDWSEIYYALEDKVRGIKDGAYGPEIRKGENKDWIAHLKEIMETISSRVDV